MESMEAQRCILRQSINLLLFKTVGPIAILEVFTRACCVVVQLSLKAYDMVSSKPRTDLIQDPETSCALLFTKWCCLHSTLEALRKYYCLLGNSLQSVFLFFSVDVITHFILVAQVAFRVYSWALQHIINI